MKKRVASRVIVAIRIGAGLLSGGVMVLTWKAMAALPWQADVVLAAVAVLAWAYRFERPGEP
jgi:hypothetical protein